MGAVQGDDQELVTKPHARKSPTIIVNPAIVVFIPVFHQFLYVILSDGLSCCLQHDLQLLQVDVAISISVPGQESSELLGRGSWAGCTPPTTPPRCAHSSYLSNILKRSESSSSVFPLLSSFIHRTIITRNSSKSTVPLPVGRMDILGPAGQARTLTELILLCEQLHQIGPPSFSAQPHKFRTPKT